MFSFKHYLSESTDRYITDRLTNEKFRVKDVWLDTLDQSIGEDISINNVELRVGSRLFNHIDKMKELRLKNVEFGAIICGSAYEKEYSYPLMITFSNVDVIQFCELLDCSLPTNGKVKEYDINLWARLISSIEYLKLLGEKKSTNKGVIH